MVCRNVRQASRGTGYLTNTKSVWDLLSYAVTKRTQLGRDQPMRTISGCACKAPAGSSAEV
jgi:hypothetical protein